MPAAGDYVGISLEQYLAMNVCGATILVDGSFVPILHSASLAELDLRKVASATLRMLNRLALLHNSGATLFHVGDPSVQGHENRPFLFVPVQTLEIGEHRVTSTVSAVPHAIAGLIASIKQACRRLSGKERRRQANAMARGDVGFKLAHELAHAFGIHQLAPRCQGLSIDNLELLADAVAFRACDSIFGEPTHLGAGYLHRNIRERGEEVTRMTVMDAAQRVLTDLRIDETPPK
jgi:hypothetical protein